MLEQDGTCKLADFGSSKKNIGSISNNTFCGTPYWMAPEVVSQSGHNRFADIWSLGCLVYEMISQKPPWSETSNIMNLLMTIANANKPPQYPVGLSEDLVDFLNCCFKKNP